jgi:acyl-CoA dehydrogenase
LEARLGQARQRADAPAFNLKDRMGNGPNQQVRGQKRLSEKVSMFNYWANRLCCQAADQASQVHGGIGYSRRNPLKHNYRHHRRYRIAEGREKYKCAQ